MAADASISDTRILIAHCSSWKNQEQNESQCKLVHLKNPKSGTATCYLVAPDGRLQELHWFKQSYAAWFIGDFVCSDGSLYIASPVDPIYMILPILEQVRMKKGDDMGKFRALDEIMYVDGFPGYVHLLPVLASCLELICELREVGQDKYYRLDDSKVLAWLCCKVKCTSEALLSSSNKYFSGLSEEDLKVYVVGLLGEYLKVDPWLNMLCQHMGVDLEASKKARLTTISNVQPMYPEQASLTNKQAGQKANGKTMSSKKKSQPGTQKITSFFARPR